MRIPLIAGREFTEADNERASNVVVLAQALARRYWQRAKPVGEHIRLDYGTGEEPREFAAPCWTSAAFEGAVPQLPRFGVSGNLW